MLLMAVNDWHAHGLACSVYIRDCSSASFPAAFLSPLSRSAFTLSRVCSASTDMFSGLGSVTSTHRQTRSVENDIVNYHQGCESKPVTFSSPSSVRLGKLSKGSSRLVFGTRCLISGNFAGKCFTPRSQ